MSHRPKKIIIIELYAYQSEFFLFLKLVVLQVVLPVKKRRIQHQSHTLLHTPQTPMMVQLRRVKKRAIEMEELQVKQLFPPNFV